MAATGTPTPNIGLRIPQGTDPASVDDINYNSNLLDTKLGAVGNTSVQDQIDSLNSKLIPSNVSYSFTANVTGLANDTSVRKIGNILIVNIAFTANGSNTLGIATFSGVSIMATQYCLFREVNSATTKRGYVNNNELTIVDAEANKQYIGVATFAIT